MKIDVLIIGGRPGGSAAAMRAELTDAFAGRVYETEHQPSNAILQFRKMLKRQRDYDHPDGYSIPIGSRYHPERAALWAPDSVVETTEKWMDQGNGQEAEEEANRFAPSTPALASAG